MGLATALDLIGGLLGVGEFPLRDRLRPAAGPAERIRASSKSRRPEATRGPGPAMAPRLASGWSSWTAPTIRTAVRNARQSPDAVSPKRAAQPRRARGVAKGGRGGRLEAICAPMVAKHSVRPERARATNGPGP